MKQKTLTFLSLLILPVICVANKVAQVVLLLGQSNAQGFGSVEQFYDLASVNNEFYAYLDPRTGAFKNRRDIRIAFDANQKLPPQELTIGLGPNPSTRLYFGPEIGLGWTLGDYFENPLLIVKVAAGGSSLAETWRPPSAPPRTNVTGDAADGLYYQILLDTVKQVTTNISSYVPGVDSYEIAGIVWFQGWADAFNEAFRLEYQDNLRYLVTDLLEEFGNPDLPFLIGELGQGGVFLYIREVSYIRGVQRLVADSFGRNVAFVPTAQYVVEDESQQPAPTDVGHYYQSALTMIRIGNAFGKAIIEILTPTGPPSEEPTIAPSTSSPSNRPSISASPSGSFTPSLYPSDSQNPSGSSLPSSEPSNRPSFRLKEKPVKTQQEFSGKISDASYSPRSSFAPSDRLLEKDEPRRVTLNWN
jgi:alpha-galactosidase